MNKLLSLGLLSLALLAGNFNNSINANEHLPKGSYKQTCRDCRVSGNLLKCSCKDGRGGSKNTSLRLNEIFNDHGNLRYEN